MMTKRVPQVRPSAVMWNKDGKVTALPNGQRTTAINSKGLILGTNKRLVASLWQLSAAAGAAPSDGVVTTLGDDGTPVGSKALPGATFPRCSGSRPTVVPYRLKGVRVVVTHGPGRPSPWWRAPLLHVPTPQGS
ncbi:hypothetical protein AB0D14_09205 [Streptomyces sp. NPDC048484]|uniref:hypothetical protein n=1 Tax=Streptomyces sp. NPDC048484 TaxID=3155146 RepID=UPI00343FC5DD